MKKNLVMIRFGSPTPLPKEVKLVAEKVIAPEDSELAMGMPFHDMGTISIFHTALTAKELTRLMEQLAIDTGDVLPCVVLDLDSREECGMHLADVNGFSAMVSAFVEKLRANQPAPAQVGMSLDELLDLANRKGGINRLNADELQLLKKLSENL